MVSERRTLANASLDQLADFASTAEPESRQHTSAVAEFFRRQTTAQTEAATLQKEAAEAQKQAAAANERAAEAVIHMATAIGNMTTALRYGIVALVIALAALIGIAGVSVWLQISF